MLFLELKDVFGRPNANGAAGATLMKVDLQRSMLKLRLCGPGLPPLTTTSTNAESDILNILGRGHKCDGRSSPSDIVSSVALMNLLSFASALADDSCGPSLHRRSALSSTQGSATSTFIGSRSD